MVAFPARPILTSSTPPNGGTGHSPDPLSSLTGCNALLNDLLELTPAEISRIDLAVLNLLCAPTLPGSEGLNIPDCLARLDSLATHVKAATERNLYRFPSDPDYGRCEPMWRMCMLVTALKRDYGAKYNPKHVAAIAAGRPNADVSDSRDSFLHGLLDADPDRRFGTCASIPVLVAAVARRLGYPVGLVVAGRHVFNRWNGGGLHFNIEASNPAGMTVESDDHYRRLVPWPGATPAELNSPYHLRTLSAEEEFSLFLSLRVECLVQAGRFDETLLW